MTATKTTTATTATLLQAFLSAQRASVLSAITAKTASTTATADYVTTAIACSLARQGGITEAALVKANIAALKDMPADAPRNSMFVAKSSITVLAFTGDVLRKPVEVATEGEKDIPAIKPSSLSSAIRKGYKRPGVGADPVRSAIKSAKTQQAAYENLLALLALPDAEGDAESDETDESESVESVESVESGAQTVETLLARALAMITEGALLTEASVTLALSVLDAIESELRPVAAEGDAELAA